MLTPGARFDRFVVEDLLGKGGMAAVYRVRHTGLGSPHALKVLDVPFPHVRARLVQEGRVQAALQHPNIVAVTDLIEVDGAPGLVMELVAGPSLDVWLRTNRADAETADLLFRGILDGVDHAHAHGLVHRDLKPANVLVATIGGRLVPKVSDFGIAKVVGEGFGAGTRTGFAMGTPGYMAPEQIRSAKNVDARADVFALGCILHELWTGAPPFPGEDVYTTLTAIEERRWPRARDVRPDIPPHVERIIAGCLEPDLDRRLADCAAIRALLDAADAAGPPAAPRAPTSTRSGAGLPPAVRSAPTFAPGTLDPGVGGPPTRPGRGDGVPGWLLALGVGVVAAVACVGLGTSGLLAALSPLLATDALVGAEPDEDLAPVDPYLAPPDAGSPSFGSTTPSPDLSGAAPEVRPPTLDASPPAPRLPPASPELVPGARRPAATVTPTSEPPPGGRDTGSAPPMAEVYATGADDAWLVGSGRRVELGIVPVGTYTLYARFGESTVEVARGLRLRAGDQRMVLCDPAFAMCQVLSP